MLFPRAVNGGEIISGNLDAASLRENTHWSHNIYRHCSHRDRLRVRCLDMGKAASTSVHRH